MTGIAASLLAFLLDDASVAILQRAQHPVRLHEPNLHGEALPLLARGDFGRYADRVHDAFHRLVRICDREDARLLTDPDVRDVGLVDVDLGVDAAGVRDRHEVRTGDVRRAGD